MKLVNITLDSHFQSSVYADVDNLSNNLTPNSGWWWVNAMDRESLAVRYERNWEFQLYHYPAGSLGAHFARKLAEQVVSGDFWQAWASPDGTTVMIERWLAPSAEVHSTKAVYGARVAAKATLENSTCYLQD